MFVCSALRVSVCFAVSVCALFSVGFGWLGLLFDCVVCACFRLVLFGVFWLVVLAV